MTLWLVAIPGFLFVYCVSVICNVMSVVVSAAAGLLVLWFFGSHYNNSVGSVKSRLQNVKSQYQYAYGKALTSERLVLRAIFLTLPDALDENPYHLHSISTLTIVCTCCVLKLA